MAIFNRTRFQSYYRYKNIINVNKNAKLEEFYKNIGKKYICGVCAEYCGTNKLNHFKKNIEL